MSFYQGRALRAAAPQRRATRGRRVVRVLQALLVVLGIVAIAHLPWDSWRRRFAAVADVRVEGAEYLDPHRVAQLAGVKAGDDLIDLDLDRIRQELLLHARIADATVSRRGLRGLAIRVRERRPVLLVRHGGPWEMDSTGVLLAPFAEGEVADVPLLTGPEFESYPEGALLRTMQVRRGLGWVQALSGHQVQLSGRVSEIDVTDDRSTALLLMNGTRVLSPAWPPDERRLSALRVVLADLEKRGTAAQEVDLRFDDQVIVRPVVPEHESTALVARTS
jgi:cell division septal protein FtsQ